MERKTNVESDKQHAFYYNTICFNLYWYFVDPNFDKKSDHKTEYIENLYSSSGNNRNFWSITYMAHIIFPYA